VRRLLPGSVGPYPTAIVEPAATFRSPSIDDGPIVMPPEPQSTVPVPLQLPAVGLP